MNSARWSRVRALFEAALDLPAEQREAALRAGAGSDSELLAEALRLLSLHRAEETDGAHEPPFSADLGTPNDGPSAPVPLPPRIGPFVPVQLLGSGGMGTVYAADQEYPRRRVALKVLRGAWIDRRARQRFADEVDTLARLQHPGIARVLEAGEQLDATAAAQPWFAMELVEDARTLLDYARERPLRQRVALLAEVAEAVQHGHLNGVIHRDLKPSNILVDAQGRPKVIDFGVARAASADEGGAPHTQTGELVGTPAWMAPEQFEGRADVRSDVYALGLLLYELVAGRAPYQLAGRSLTESARIVQHQPPLPLCRAAPEAPVELEWIASAALAKEPEQRYASAGALAADLRRWIGGETPRAGAPSQAYRLRAFARRHRAGVAAAALLAGSLAAGVIGTSYGWLRADEQARRADEQARRANSVTSLLVSLFEAPDPALDGHELRVVDALERADRRLSEDLAGQPDLESELRHALGKLYHGLGLYPLAAAELERAAELAAAASSAPEQADSLRAELALTWIELGKLEQAEQALAESLAWRRAHLGERSAAVGEALNSLALLRLRQHRLDEAEASFRETAEILGAALGADHERTLAATMNLAAIAREEKRLDEADRLLTPAVAGLRARLGDRHPLSIKGVNNLAVLRAEQRRFAESAELMALAMDVRGTLLPEGHPELEGTASNLVAIRIVLGELDQAEALLLPLLERRARRGPLHEPDALTMLGNLVAIHVARADGAAVAASVERMLGARPAEAATELRAASILENTARHLARNGHGAPAELVMAESLGVRRRLQGEAHPDTLQAELRRIQLVPSAATPEEQLERLAALHRTATAAFPDGHAAAGTVGLELGRALVGAKRLEEAWSVMPAAAEILLRLAGPEEGRAAAASCAELCLLLGRAEEAEGWRARGSQRLAESSPP